jgi:hypothetical protein
LYGGRDGRAGGRRGGVAADAALADQLAEPSEAFEQLVSTGEVRRQIVEAVQVGQHDPDGPLGRQAAGPVADVDRGMVCQVAAFDAARSGPGSSDALAVVSVSS